MRDLREHVKGLQILFELVNLGGSQDDGASLMACHGHVSKSETDRRTYKHGAYMGIMSDPCQR